MTSDMVKVIMPKLGMTMSKGVIMEWKKKEGDKVEKGEIIVTVSSEKITNDIEAPEKGIIKKILYDEGNEVPVGETIALIETSHGE
jgi:pyruvate/2-oxoglutarate dehydrogenase complex dihydrolipoamide acyltransferase (E2) component